MSTDLPLYSVGRIAMDNGDLMQAVTGKLNVKRSNKLIHTLRGGRGKFHGPPEATLTISGVVPEDGAERDYLTMLLKGRIKTVRFKIPGETISFKGSIDERDVETTLEDAIKNDITMTGFADNG